MSAVRRKLLLNTDETPLSVTTWAQALRRIQEWASGYVAPGRVVSEELLEERRREAAGEFKRARRRKASGKARGR